MTEEALIRKGPVVLQSSIVEASSNRDHYTKHGLHLNNYGKEELVKQIVIQINSVKWIVNSKTPIPLL
jgi:hypothetical protein